MKSPCFRAYKARNKLPSFFVMRYWLLLLLIMLAPSAWAKTTTTIAMPAITTKVTTISPSLTLLRQDFAADPFYAINVTGPYAVQITRDQSRPALELVGDADSLANVYAAVKDGVLYLGMQPKYTPGPNSSLVAKVKACPSFKQFLYSGNSNVTVAGLSGLLYVDARGSGTVLIAGKDVDLRDLRVAGTNNVHVLGVKSNLLNVQDSGSGKVNVYGTMVLQNLIYDGQGPLTLYWIDSSNIKVIGAGRGRIFLAGTGGLLDATLSKHTYFDAKYLKVNRAFISTRDSARADVWAKCSLSALATDKSNIYYYHDPILMMGSYMGPPGAVVRMTGIDPRLLPVPPQPCCVYTGPRY